MARTLNTLQKHKKCNGRLAAPPRAHLANGKRPTVIARVAHKEPMQRVELHNDYDDASFTLIKCAMCNVNHHHDDWIKRFDDDDGIASLHLIARCPSFSELLLSLWFWDYISSNSRNLPQLFGKCRVILGYFFGVKRFWVHWFSGTSSDTLWSIVV